MNNTTNNDEPGYVYIITNPSFREGLIKLGCTSGTIEDRLRGLQTTGVPLPFELYASLKTKNYKQVEKHMHYVLTALTETRVSENREFYDFPKDEAYKLLESASNLVNDGCLILASDIMETEEKTQEQDVAGRGSDYRAFWARFLEYDGRNDGVFAGLSAPSRSWLGKSLCAKYGLSLNVERGRDYIRISIYFTSPDKSANKSLFDRLYNERNGIEERYGKELEWQRLSEKIACRIKDEIHYENDIKSFSFLSNNGKLLKQIFNNIL